MELERARVVGDGLRFESGSGFASALRAGCFLLAIPSDLDVSPGVKLCREFYRPAQSPDAGPEGYRGFRNMEGAYFDREHFQTEHILLDGAGRSRYLPSAVADMCDRMSQLGLDVLCAVLNELAIPRELWSTVTGGAVDGRGTHWFAASHYRPERDQLGCAPHKDTGFVTILYIDQLGLEALVDSAWTPIDPVPGYFVVNFGGAFELLTEPLTRSVQAILHRVRKCERIEGVEDRFSFAAFANPPASGDLYQVRDDGSASGVGSVEEFLREFNKQTWNDRHDDFGIVADLPGAGAATVAGPAL